MREADVTSTHKEVARMSRHPSSVKVVRACTYSKA